MYFDGYYTLKGAGAGVVLIPPKDDFLKYVIQLKFPATNNIAEYEGLCDRPTSKMRGFVSQDHIGGFSTKRECANTHK
jgi:hypothetical protein